MDITFALWDQENDGTAVWTEVRDGGNQVQVDDGFFTVYLGSVTTLFAVVRHDHHDTYYTEGEVNTALALKADAGHDHEYALADQICSDGQRVKGINADGSLICGSIVPTCTIRTTMFSGLEAQVACQSDEICTGGGADLSDGSNNGLNWNNAGTYPSGNGWYCMRDMYSANTSYCYAVCCTFPN